MFSNALFKKWPIVYTSNAAPAVKNKKTPAPIFPAKVLVRNDRTAKKTPNGIVSTVNIFHICLLNFMTALTYCSVKVSRSGKLQDTSR